MPDDSTKITPNAKQQAFINAYASDDCSGCVSEACRISGCHRTTVYYWLDDPDFRAYWEEQREHDGYLMLKSVDEAIGRAAKGKARDVNTAAAKLLYERFDRKYAPRAKQEIELTGNDALLDALRAKTDTDK